MPLFHVFDLVDNRRTGVPMAGVQVRAKFDDTDTIAPIYADQSGTAFDPANYCVTDADGMFSFYIDSGEYTLEFLVGDVVLKTIPDFRPAEIGPSGPANSTYNTTAEIESADVSNVSAILAEVGKAGTFTTRDYVDFTAQVAADPGKINYIRSVSDPTKVWVRTSILSDAASQTGASSGLTVDAELAAKATLTGVARTATNLGTFTGSTIPDNQAIKGAIQALETAVENTTGNAATKVNATAVGVAATDSNMGTTPGFLSDNGTAKDWFQEIEGFGSDDAAKGTGLIGFRQSDDADARGGFLLTKLREFVSVEDYYVGNPDDTDAVQKALERGSANGVECRAVNRTHTIGGTIYNPGAVLAGAGKATIFQKSGLGPLFLPDYTAPTRQGYYGSDVAAHAWGFTLDNIAHAANFTVGAYAILAGNEYYDSPNLDPQKKGEFVRVKSIVGNVVSFYGPTLDSYATSGGVKPELIPVSLVEGIEYRDFLCAMDTTVGVVGGADSGTEQRHVITTKWALEPKFINIRMRDSLGSGIALEGCLFARVREHYARQFGSASASDGTSTEGTGGYGYGIMERGLNFGLDARGLRYESLRHGYSNGGSYTTTFGRPVGWTVDDGIHWNARAAGWDCHEIGFGGTMSNLKTIGGRSGGFSLRCDGVKWNNIAAINCAAYAIALWKGSTENAERNIVDGLYISETNWGDDAAEDASTNWKLRGAIIDQGTSNTVRNVVVDSCYGPLYETGANSTGTRLENVRASNINKVGAANKALWLRATGATTPILRFIDIDVSNGYVDDLVLNDSTSGNNIPQIHEVRPLGSISGKYYNGAGVGTDLLVHWTGDGFEGRRASFTLNGTTSINLSGVIEHRVTVSKTTTEKLTTATGRRVEGARLIIVAGSSGATVAHSASGNDTFFCRGGADLVLSSGQSATFINRSGAFVEEGDHP